MTFEIMVGEHWSEIEDENRLIHQIEKNLGVNLSLLDYWNPEVYDNEIEIDKLLITLGVLKNKIEKHPLFYENISYGFDLKERYFKSQFFNDIIFLIELIQLSKEEKALKIKYETQ